MSIQANDRLALVVRDLANRDCEGFVLCAEVEESSALLISGFARRSAPDLEIGKEVRLCLPRLRSEAGSEIPARVMQRSEDRMQVRYHFEVGHGVGLILARMTDRRFAARVRPYPLAPLHAILERGGGGAPIRVSVKDISATGIAVVVPIEQEGRFFSEWSVRLRLEVPVNGGVGLDMVGKVCSRRLEGSGICYGIDFDGEATSEFSRKQDVIFEYVSGCQAAAIYMFRHGTVDLEFPDLFGDEGVPGALSALSQEAPTRELAAAHQLDTLSARWLELSDEVRHAILVLVEEHRST